MTSHVSSDREIQAIWTGEKKALLWAILGALSFTVSLIVLGAFHLLT